jgi:hypothetical protein
MPLEDQQLEAVVGGQQTNNAQPPQVGDATVNGLGGQNAMLYQAAANSSGQFHAEFVKQLSTGAAGYSASES